MRICEILNEDSTADEIKNDLMDVLMAYKQKGINKIPMKKTETEEGVLTFLRKIGYDITSHNVSEILSKPPFDSIVKRSGVDDIELKTDQPDSTPSKSQQEKSEEKIDRIAKKAAKKAVHSGEAK
jgi:hypothetical protein